MGIKVGPVVSYSLTRANQTLGAKRTTFVYRAALSGEDLQLKARCTELWWCTRYLETH